MIDDSSLFHGTYDPVKAREYYLKTRKLKGRQRAAPKAISSRRSRSSNLPAVRSVQKPNRANTATRRAELERQKAALEKRLEHLRDVLADLVTAAKKRSGVEEKEKAKGKAPETPADKADRNSAEKKSKPETASQKKERAKKAKEQYEKEHPNSLSKDVDILREQVQDIRAKIEQAVEDARRKKAGSNASKSGSKNSKPDGPRGR